MAHTNTLLSLMVVIFQIALAMGAPWGERAWGGRYIGVLPLGMRIASVFSAVLICAFAMVIQIRAGNILPQYLELSQPLSWIVVGYSAVGIVMNAITPSKKERNLWLPVVSLLFVTSCAVALAD
jgi:hypothetical protein